MKMSEQVVITGSGLVTSLGKTPEENWDAISSGRSGLRPISGFDAGGFTCRVAAEVGKIDPDSLGIHPRDSRIMDTHAYLLLMASRHAYNDAGLDRAGFAPEEIGYFAGMGMVDYRTEDMLPAVMKSIGPDGQIVYPSFYAEGYREIYPLWPLSMLNNITFCQVGIDLNIRGENAVFCPHADSGTQALTEAMRTVFEQRAKAVISGGVSEKISPLSLARLHLSAVAGTGSGADDAALVPFGRDNKGTLLGEGAGMITLELRDSADRRGAPYSAMISGYGHACEPMQDQPAPSSRAIGNAMRRALDTASLQPADIDLIIAHGDGTHFGDQNEAEAIIDAFRINKDVIPVYSSKAAFGNLLAGAPASDIIVGMQIMRKGIIPPVLRADSEPATQISAELGLVIGRPLIKDVRRIMVNCRSYEGQAASIIIEAVP